MTAHALVYRAARRAIRPKSPLTVSEWADANRVLSGEGSAEAGAWKTSRTPYLREIMDALSEDSPCRKVVFMKSSQVGGTEAGSNWLGYIMGHAKGPVAVVMPTEKAMADWASQKFDPMAKDTPAIAAVLATRSNRAGDNSAQRKRFTGGILYFKTAGSTTELKSTSLRYAIADEVDEWDWSTLQGDPLGLLEIRQTTYHDRKLFVVSSPTMKDASRIEEQYDRGDQRRYYVPCPHCGERQHLKWPNVRWQKGLGGRVTRAWYVCEACGAEIDEHHKPAMLAGGRWIAGNPDGAWRSYHINAVYAPIGLGLSWAELADEWIAAQDDQKDLQVFINTRLGEPWADRSHDVKPNEIAARAEPYALGTLPPGVLYLTAGVDVQSGYDSRLEVRIVGWGWENNEIREWVIDYQVIRGNLAEDRPWQDLEDLLTHEYKTASGVPLPIDATGIDTGGHFTHEVYAFVRRTRARRVLALKGASTPGRKPLGNPNLIDINWRGKKIKNGVALYLVGTDSIKRRIYDRIIADGKRPADDRLMHFSNQLEPSFYDQQIAEVFNPRKNRWENKKGKNNEALDTHVYATAVTYHIDLAFDAKKPAFWKRRALMLEPKQTTDQTPTEATSAETIPQPTYRGRPRRRVVSSAR